MADSQNSDQKPVLIEQTGKKYKAIRAVGILILLGSAGIGILTADEFGAGIVLSWWHHG